MNKFLLCLGFCAVFCLAGCISGVTNSSLRYSVDFKNVGTKKIKVKEITLCASEASSVAACGDLPPKGNASYGSFSQIPNLDNIIEWTDIESNDTSSVKIKIQLPKLFFNAEYPSEIIFYINPDTTQVQVAYKVFSPEKQDFIIVDSYGKPFELKK